MEFVCPNNLGETLSTLKKWKGRAKLIAGGTNVLPEMRANRLKPGLLPGVLPKILIVKAIERCYKGKE